MKNISIIAEGLKDGSVRITGRYNDVTICSGTAKLPVDVKPLLAKIMSSTAGHHQRDDGTYDLTYIELNPLAQTIYNF